MSLAEAELMAIIPATDLDRARAFYEDKLGLPVESVMEAGVLYRCAGGSALFLYPAGRSGAPTTAAGWNVADITATVADLRGQGIAIEEFDLPGLETVDGIADLGSELAAWFKDSEGNTLAVSQFK